MRLLYIAMIGSLGGVVPLEALAAEDFTTHLKNPKTGDVLTLRTDKKGTFAQHSHGPSGYIERPGYETAETSSRDAHETYVQSYEKAGYLRQKGD